MIMQSKLSFLVSCALLLLALSACGSDSEGSPKPHAYPRIEFPLADSVVSYRIEVCPFSFQSPSYVQVEKDTTFFDEKPKHPCWFDLVTPSLNARVHLSYYPINSRADFEKHRDDAYTLVGKHNIVASYIDEQPIAFPERDIYGYSFGVEGEAASPYQLFITDSSRHFLRAAIYVNAQAKPDSLAPVYDFLRQDLNRVVSTLRWEQP